MAGRIGSTINGHDPFEVVSAIQKCIRRGLEREAMAWCLEMAHSSKSFYSWMLGRLNVIAHEDIGLADPDAVRFVMETTRIAKDYHEKQGWRIMFGNCVRVLCRAEKSREGDHFVWITLHAWNTTGPGDIPDVALDQHTRRGKQLGRGLDHFLDIGTQLDREHPDSDCYRVEAYALKRQSPPTGQDAPDEEPPRKTTLF